MADVFISYKREDRLLAEQLQKQVVSWGFTVWWDPELPAGKDYMALVWRELQAAGATIVLWTDRSIRPTEETDSYSSVLAEAKWALDNTTLIPVVVPPLEAKKLPPPFNTPTAILEPDRERILEELIRSRIPRSGKITVQTYQRQDVFKIGGIPTHTEVDRSRTKGFQDLQANLQREGCIVRLFGATQTGKTVLARQALQGFRPFELHGSDLDTIESFYDSIAINYAPGLEADARKHRVTKFLKDSKRPIIIDDFHMVPETVRTAIIDDAKGLIQNGVHLVLISIPDAAASALKRTEFKNRSIAIPAPHWLPAQLRQIPRDGFAKLRVQVHPSVVEEIIHQAYRNPLLVQDYCYKVCEKRGILKSNETGRPAVVPRNELTNIFKEISKARAYDMSQVLNQSGDDRFTLAGEGGRAVSLHAYILIVLDSMGGFQPLKPKTIAGRARALATEESRGKIKDEAIKKAGEELIARLKETGQGDTTIDMKDDNLYILHPDFKVHLHWRLVPQLTHVQPQLAKFVDHTADDIQKLYAPA